MKNITAKVEIYGEPCEVELMEFSKSDAKGWKRTFDMWKAVNTNLKLYKARSVNMPEGLSEVAFCILTGSKRFIKITRGKASGSFDTFNIKGNRAEQIKACSIETDLTSFGPKSKWDDLYFMDFYNGGLIDGVFDLYQIPNELIYNHKINKLETFLDQQIQKRRPRLEIKKLLLSSGLKPIASKVKIW